MKKNLVLFGILALVSLLAAGVTLLTKEEGGKAPGQVKFRIVTSFYPVYIAAWNVADGIEGVEVSNMTENKGGCLHDYQLTAEDMKKLEGADVFVINGAGMESFLETILGAYPDLTVIDLSQGIPLLESRSHSHEEESQESGQDRQKSYNGHIWMNPDTYEMQIANLVEGLQAADKVHGARYSENGQAYREKVHALGEELAHLREGEQEENVVLFHDAYAYLADKLRLRIVHQVVMEEDTSLSAGEVREIIEEIEENQVSFLFAEKQFSAQIPMRIAEETKTEVIVVDSLVSGELDKNSYIDGMKENIRILKEKLEESHG